MSLSGNWVRTGGADAPRTGEDTCMNSFHYNIVIDFRADGGLIDWHMGRRNW